jgi:hypothetical protein
MDGDRIAFRIHRTKGRQDDSINAHFAASTVIDDRAATLSRLLMNGIATFVAYDSAILQHQP